MNVTKLPTKFRHPRIISAQEHWQMPEPTDQMVWAACEYTRPVQSEIEVCERCPPHENHERYGRLKRGCRAMAEGACRNVMAAMKKHPPQGKK